MTDEVMLYRVNPAGGYGLPEVWVCHDCMAEAEPNSRAADLRETIYSADFGAAVSR